MSVERKTDGASLFGYAKLLEQIKGLSVIAYQHDLVVSLCMYMVQKPRGNRVDNHSKV